MSNSPTHATRSAGRVGIPGLVVSLLAVGLPVLLWTAPPAAATPDAYSTQIIADNPISYWRLGEASGSTAQDERAANPGTYAGGATPNGQGVVKGNTAAHFDGSSGYVSLGTPASLRPNSFTVEAWFRNISSSPAAQKIYRVRWYGMWLAVSARRLEGLAYYGINGSDYHVVTSGQNVNDGRWHHAALTKDGVNLVLYLDGAQVASTPMTEATFYNASQNTGVAIGRDGDYSGDYFLGDIDEVAVYDHALTAAQVQNHFGLGTAPPTGGTPTTAETRSHVNESEPWTCPCHGHHADPVDSATGIFAETYTDLAIPGRGVPLSFSRTYSSAAAATDGPLGFGWTHSYAASLAEDLVTGTVTITQEGGSQVVFTPSGNTYSAPPRVVATLVHNGDGTWTFTRRAREIRTFDASGKLTAQRDLNGYTTSVAYASGQLSSVTDPAGRTPTFGWTGSHITGVTDTASPPRTVTFSYDGSGNLTDAVDAGGGHWQFTYDALHRLTTVGAPKYYGDTTTTPTPVTTNHYDASGRVDWQSDPLGRCPGSTFLDTFPENRLGFDGVSGLGDGLHSC